MSQAAAHATAVRATVTLLRSADLADPATFGLPTPCAGWTFADLLAHMTVQHEGFTAAVTGARAGTPVDPAVWQVRPLGTDPLGDYAAAAERVIAAFAADGALDAPCVLPEISTTQTFPGRAAMRFHLVDYVVHGWDVAKTLDLPFDLPADVLDAALAVAERVPSGASRLAPGAAFAPAVPAPAGAATLDRIVALLGRSPTWPLP